MPRKNKTTNTRALERFQQVDASAATAERVVENDAQLLRQSISSLFRAGSTLRSFRYATRKIEPNLGTEQLWSQLQILYAPALKTVENAFESTSNFQTLATKLKESEEQAKKSSSSIKQKARAGGKSSSSSSKNNRRLTVDGDDNDSDDSDENDGKKTLSLMDMMKNKKDGRLPGFVQELDRQEQARLLKKKLAKEGASLDGTSRVGNFAFGLGSSSGKGKGKKSGANDDDEDDVMMQQEFGGAEHNDDDGAANIFASGNARRRNNKRNEFERYGDEDDAEFDADDLLDDDADDDELARRAKNQAREFGGGGGDDDEEDDEEGFDDEEMFDDDEEGLDFDGEEGEEEEGDDDLDEDNEDNRAMKEMYGANDGTFNAEDFEDDEDDDVPPGDDMDEEEFRKFKRAYDEEESLEDEEDRKIESELVAKRQPQTAFEAAEMARQERIRQAEQDRLAGSWEMAGEVAAIDRPRDALLNTDLIMEHAMTTAPIITESLTLRLEERLKRRILANNFDDVIRKNPKLVQFDEKDARVLRQEQYEEQSQKSKASLVDLYEKEFLDKQSKAAAGGGKEGAAAEPLSQVEQDELKALQQWRRISQHLDALSNFFFTPKPAANDLDARVRAVQDQAPAISVESKGMFALSREKVLAPQDVFRPKKGQAAALMTSKEEMTPGEKRNLRAAQKRTFHMTKELEDKRNEEKKKAREAKQKQREGAVNQD